jgi:hypothetical protein
MISTHSTCRILLGFACLLSACTSQTVKDTLGLERTAPDEYRVVSRPPLSVPPEFDLRPPVNGESDLPVQPADKLARSLVTGEAPPSAQNGTSLPASTVDTAVKPVESAPAPTPADAQFLANAGVDKADPDVRGKIYEDKQKYREQESSWMNKFTFGNSDSKTNVVDPSKEAQRLREENIPVKAPVPDAVAKPQASGATTGTAAQ